MLCCCRCWFVAGAHGARVIRTKKKGSWGNRAKKLKEELEARRKKKDAKAAEQKKKEDEDNKKKQKDSAKESDSDDADEWFGNLFKEESGSKSSSEPPPSKKEANSTSMLKMLETSARVLYSVVSCGINSITALAKVRRARWGLGRKS